MVQLLWLVHISYARHSSIYPFIMRKPDDGKLRTSSTESKGRCRFVVPLRPLLYATKMFLVPLSKTLYERRFVVPLGPGPDPLSPGPNPP